MICVCKCILLRLLYEDSLLGSLLPSSIDEKFRRKRFFRFGEVEQAIDTTLFGVHQNLLKAYKHMTDNFDSPLNTSPEMSVAGLPTTLIVASLNTQLARGPEGYTETDYLSVIMNTVSMLRDRHAGDGELMAELNFAIRAIFSKVINAINTEWDIDLFQIALDPDSGSYESDVTELYRFFVTGRLQNARDLLLQIVINSRKRILEANRRTVDKRNQTIAEARRVFQSFDDVVIWMSIPQFLADLKADGGWNVDLRESLLMLDADSSALISRIATIWNLDDFAERFCNVAMTRANMSTTEMDLKTFWMEDAPKKVASVNSDRTEYMELDAGTAVSGASKK